MLTPPYGTCLTDYVGSNRFQCNVLMRDMHATGYKFYIFMTVKDMASGRVVFSAQSDKHTITPGMPTYMAETGVFAEFFKPENILVSTAYKDGCLKEGSYNFVFQVVDARDTRRIPISKECVFPARLVAGGAPLLISPFTGTNIECGQTFVNFTWQMPIVTGEQTKYLIEICPTDEGGNGLHYLGSYTPSANGVGPSQGYIRATSYMPMYQLLESAEKKFVPNTTYFWRVSIIDELGNVKPNSTSEIDSFTYCYTKELEPYTPLKEPKVKAINSELDTVHIDTVKTEDNATNAYWFLDDVRFKYQSYALDIRKKSQDTWTTYHIKINEGDTEEKNYYGLSNLKYNEPYEARMQYLLITDNDTSYAPFSDTITFVVPNPMDTADCGEIMPIKDCNEAKGRILEKYDTLYANGTPVVLDSIIYKAGDSTVISGYGVISFPILKNFKLKMRFNEVSVNCYGELISGQVVSVYNESTGAIIDLNHITGKGDGGGSQSSNERPEPSNYKDKDEAKEKMQTGDYAQIGDSIYTKDKDGNIVTLGKALSIPAGKYTNNNTLDDDDVYCIFRNDTEKAPYIGFDADEHKYYRGRPTLGDHYTPTFSKQDGADFEYIIPYVASNPGRVVKLSATLEGRLTDEYNKDSVKFIMPLSGGDYLDLNAKKDGDKFIVDFPGGKNPDTNSDVYAIVKKGEKYVNVGKINIETYAWRTQKVKIVPVVNDYGVDEKAISETLNRIYGRFGITYEVTKDDRFESENINSEFLDNFSVSSGTFTKQSDDMKRLQYDYKAERGLEDSTAYIFLLKSAVDYPAIDGDMPQGQICGYIFMHSDNGTLSDGRLVAHELAHGIYRLDHVFEKAYGIPENSTDNLLDYNNGDQLAHFQWELIKNPGFAWALLESDEDNMAWQCVAIGLGQYGIAKAIDWTANELFPDDEASDDPWYVTMGNELLSASSSVADACGKKGWKKALELANILYNIGTKCYGKRNDPDFNVYKCVCANGISELTSYVFSELLGGLLENAKFEKLNSKERVAAVRTFFSKMGIKVPSADKVKERLQQVEQNVTGKVTENTIKVITRDCLGIDLDKIAEKVCDGTLFVDIPTPPEPKEWVSPKFFSANGELIVSVNMGVNGTGLKSIKIKSKAEGGVDILLTDIPQDVQHRFDVPYYTIYKDYDGNKTIGDNMYNVEGNYGVALPCDIENDPAGAYDVVFVVNTKEEGDKEYSIVAACDYGYTFTSFDDDDTDTEVVQNPVTKRDKCSGTDLFKATKIGEANAIAAADANRIEAECIFGLPKCSKWIQDSNKKNVYHITASAHDCNGKEVEIANLYTVTLDKEDDPYKGECVMNQKVAKNYENYEFSYDPKCNAVDSLLYKNNAGIFEMKASGSYLNENFALRVFVDVSYDWIALRKNNGFDNPNDQLKDVLNKKVKQKVYSFKDQGNLASSFSQDVNINDAVKNAISKLNFGYCESCEAIQNVYFAVAKALSETDCQLKKEMYVLNQNSSIEYLFDGFIIVSTNDINPNAQLSADRNDLHYTEAEAAEENRRRLSMVNNYLSVCLGKIAKIAGPSMGNALSSNNLLYGSETSNSDSYPNVAVRKESIDCK